MPTPHPSINRNTITPRTSRSKSNARKFGTGAADKWEKVDVEGLMADERRFAVQPLPEQVVQHYLHESMTFPMLPAAVRDWQRTGTHPSIPLVFHQDQTTAADPRIDGGQFGPVNRFRPREGAGANQSIPTAAQRRTGREGEVVEDVAAATPEASAGTPYYLFRFTDTQATDSTKPGLQPGKTYRYRVRLVLANPNYNISPAMLENPASTNEETRSTDWAVTTQPVTIAREKELLAYGLRAGGRGSALDLIDTKGKFQFHVWDRKLGAEVAHDFEIRRGDIADFVNAVKNHFNPFQDAGEEIAEFQFHYEPADGGIPFLADIRGGEPIPGPRGKTVVQPAELLFIDAEGRMFTSNEAMDGATARDYDKRYGAAPPPAAGEAESLFGETNEGANMDRATPSRRGSEQRR